MFPKSGLFAQLAQEAGTETAHEASLFNFYINSHISSHLNAHVSSYIYFHVKSYVYFHFKSIVNSPVNSYFSSRISPDFKVPQNLAETERNQPVQVSPNRVDPFYLRLLEEGKVLYEQGKTAEAVKNLEIAAFGLINDHPHLLEAYIYLVNSYYRLRDVERAAFFLSEIEQLNLKESLPASKLAPSIYDEFIRTESLLWRLGLAALTEAQRKILDEAKTRNMESKARNEIAIKEDIKKGDTKGQQAGSGQIATVAEDWPSALERLKKELSLPRLLAAKLPPVQPISIPEMIKLEEALKQDARNGVASLRLAILYEEMGNWKKARQVLTKYLKFVPDCAAHRFELSRVLLELRKPKKALEEILGTAYIFEGDVEFHKTKGKIHEQLNQPEEARREFERALSLKIGDTL